MHDGSTGLFFQSLPCNAPSFTRGNCPWRNGKTSGQGFVHSALPLAICLGWWHVSHGDARQTDVCKALKEWTSRRGYCVATLPMRLTYTQSQTSDCGLWVCKDGDIFWSRNICIWHVGDITQFMGQRLLSMWHDIGPATVTSCSTTHWSLACMVPEVRKMDKQISATQYQLPGSMSTPGCFTFTLPNP